ncbi:pancreatic triacylglycerol lipase [Diachasma alloeum]|uniref:pancreatic triacylglycerol lipase n=1 Tax=Diachasma alloeum TaxID=454923 RepID=UPI0007382D41|nr:pancreatic triacylglycerol lipase [Diachasma alloeum]
MGLKIILCSLELAFLLNALNAANLDLPSVENIQDMILEEKFIESLILPTIKEERAVLAPVLEPVLTPERDVTFHLFTRSNPGKGSALKVGDSMALKDSQFMPDRGLKVVIHGWTDKGTTKWLKIIRSNYLSEEDCNVVIVNWFPISIKEYHVAAKLTEQIGAYVGEFLHFLNAETNISLANVHILGHSLGAHIAGFAGSSLSGNVGRITGMDPARPAFEAPVYKDQKSRLDPSDAIFVDVIHTCAGTLGFIKTVGHADFYPNGGTFRQPGCSPLVTQYCSHGRSYQFMAESIVSPRAFVAIKCDSWAEYRAGKCDNSTAVMGDKVSSETRGSFFLETNAESPYGKGDSNSIF